MADDLKQQLQALLPTPDALPVFGGDTKVTLTSADTLQSLGVTVSPLGSAEVDTSGLAPTVNFPITGGTDGPGSANDVILHLGSGLELSNVAGTLDITDFRIDTLNAAIDANVSVNGVSAGNVAVFDVGSDNSTLTLTTEAATVVGQALNTTAINSNVVIGTADTSPVVNPLTLGFDEWMQFLHPAPQDGSGLTTDPVVAGTTAITLGSASTLSSLGVTVKPLGSATLDAGGAIPVANFPITGGTDSIGTANDVILHQGSGLQLSDSAGALTLRDFLIDLKNGVVDANVSVNGQAAGNVAVFNVGADGTSLTLTSTAADVVSRALGTSEITPTTVIGTATPSPITVSGALGSLFPANADQCGWFASL